MSEYREQLEELRREGKTNAGKPLYKNRMSVDLSEGQKDYQEPAPVSVLQDIENQIRDANSSLLDTLNRLSDLGDRIFGVLPERDQTDDVCRAPSCAEERVKDALDGLHRVASRLDEVQRRIDRIA